MKNYQKFIKFKKLKKLGTSPIIATIMLIGLTVFSGAVLYGVTTTYLNQKTPLSLEYTNPTSFSPTVTDYKTATTKIDSFNIHVSNPLYEQVLLNTRDSYLYNSTTNQPIYTWTVNSNSSYLLLNGRESTTLTFSTINNDPGLGLESGSQVYASFTVMRTDGTDPTTINTTVFTVKADIPVFQFIPYQTPIVDPYANANYTKVYFNAHNDEQVTVNITGALWNYGSSATSYTKTVQFSTNTSVFGIDPQFATQSVTIPSSSLKIVPNANNVCEAGDACVNITIPVTKYNLTEKNVVSHVDNYPAFLSISGLDYIPFELDFKAPTIRITLENTNQNWRGFWGWHGHRDGCYTFPFWDNNNQVFNQITFDGNPSCSDTKTVTFDIWNLLNVPNNATIEIVGLNTTAFTLYTSANSNSWRNNGYDANPQYVDLPVAQQYTGRWGRWMRNLDTCVISDIQGCNTVTWGISRNALVDSNGESTGILAGTYPVTIMDTQTGYSITVDLVISPYYKTIHVDSLEGSYSNRNLQFDMTIKDDNGNAVRGVLIEASYTYPVGNGKKTKTTTEYLLTDRNGQATFSDWNPKKGTYTFEITNLQSPFQGRWSRWFSSTTYIYDKQADNPNPPSVQVKV